MLPMDILLALLNVSVTDKNIFRRQPRYLVLTKASSIHITPISDANEAAIILIWRGNRKETGTL